MNYLEPRGLLQQRELSLVFSVNLTSYGILREKSTQEVEYANQLACKAPNRSIGLTLLETLSTSLFMDEISQMESESHKDL